jgi:hypothetical protein
MAPRADLIADGSVVPDPVIGDLISAEISAAESDTCAVTPGARRTASAQPGRPPGRRPSAVHGCIAACTHRPPRLIPAHIRGELGGAAVTSLRFLTQSHSTNTSRSPRSRWTASAGTTGRNGPDGWTECSGMGGRDAPESADRINRNAQLAADS